MGTSIYFFNKNLLNTYFLLDTVSDVILVNKTVKQKKIPAHIKFTIGRGTNNEQIYK